MLECALQAIAEAIVSMHLRDFGETSARFGLKMLKPGELVAESRKEAP